MSILFISVPLAICAALFERKPASPHRRKHSILQITKYSPD